ncbi:MAG: arginine repressor [Pseudomonadota bacterium]
MPKYSEQANHRRDAIAEFLKAGPVPTQLALVKALRQQGIEATQSAVSRDLRDLGAVKTSSGYILDEPDAAQHLEWNQVAGLIRGTAAAGPNMLVIKTAIGAAQRVALALDRADWPEVVGNVGGDDTVFTATASVVGQRNLIARIERAVPRA